MGTSLPENVSSSNTGVSTKEKLQVPQVFQKFSLLTPLKAPKSYGTYSKQQQEEVISFIKNGNSLRTAEKYFGIPKSTMHCWLKKVHVNNNDGTRYAQPIEIDTNTAIGEEKEANSRRSPLKSPSLLSTVNNTPITNPSGRSGVANTVLSNRSNKQNTVSQIVIEEAELIRFLQSGEGAELIGKAYNLPVSDFLNFVKNTQLAQSTSANEKESDAAMTLLKQSGVGVGVVKEEPTAASHYPFSTMRKRNYKTSGCNCQPPTFVTANDLKKQRLDKPKSQRGVLEALLTKPRELKKLSATGVEGGISSSSSGRGGDGGETIVVPPTKDIPSLVLTEEQIKTSNKLISQAQPGVVNTYLVTVPFSSNTTNTLTPLPKSTEDDECQLSPTYPKIINPVSIKAERIETDCMMKPPGAFPKHAPPITTFPQSLIHQATKPVVSTNANAALNLNEINRTQSERDLMALVDGDLVTADELCTDFNEMLELNKWVNSETWYADQYLQHFQTSFGNLASLVDSTTAETTPQKNAGANKHNTTVTSANPDILTTGIADVAVPTNTTSPGKSMSFDFDDEDDGGGITFVTNNDKEHIISYLSEGNSLVDAEKHFNIPQLTIAKWLDSIDSQTKAAVSMDLTFRGNPTETVKKEAQQQSAFSYHNAAPTNDNEITKYKKSAFARLIK